MSVRSVCVSSLLRCPRGPLLKRGPAMDGACPLCAFVLCGGGESQGPSTAKDAAKPPAERAQCHRLVQHSGRVTRFSVAAADLLPSILWFGNIRGFVKLNFPTVNVCPHVAKK